jgi:DNA (cytosine-5)-methyltransferase 1
LESSNGVVSLFSGIGGFELGASENGLHTILNCEIEASAQAVLQQHFPDAEMHSDVSALSDLPAAFAITAGFPCQNLSLVGDNSGIQGRDTKIVFDLFKLLERSKNHDWVVLENVPFMLWQHKGEAIRFVTESLREIGYRWAYRVVDARAFGVPQRRRRVVIVASRVHDPRTVLFSDDEEVPSWISDDGSAPCGFSWTEGRYGLGWAPNCVPTIKGGSRVGVPSPPAIWFRDSGLVGTPNIEDAERLQGFGAGWTSIATGPGGQLGARWKLVGNAIPVGLANWVCKRLKQPGHDQAKYSSSTWSSRIWPNAAYDIGGGVMKVDIGEFPEALNCHGIGNFLQHPVKPLSERASKGFLKRAREGKLKFADGFLDAIELHADNMASGLVENTEVA